ncbi:MAG: 50S ribosomal protein L28 [Candidatus Zixiibacteriota bacterium]
MAKHCPITGKRPVSGNNVSHANNKTKRRFNPNLVSKRVWNPVEKRWVRMRISTKALKTLDKKGWVR